MTQTSVWRGSFVLGGARAAGGLLPCQALWFTSVGAYVFVSGITCPLSFYYFVSNISRRLITLYWS